MPINDRSKQIRSAIPLTNNVYEAAKARLVNIFEQFDNVDVSFSGGKDSTATLMVALEVLHEHPKLAARHLPLRAVFFDEEAIPYETAEYVERIGRRDDINLEWYCLPVKHRNACSRRSPFWWPWAPEAEALWCRPLPAQAITEVPWFQNNPPEARMSMPATNGPRVTVRPGNSISLLGLRAQESLTRLRAVSRKANGENYIIESNDKGSPRYWKGYPIYDWRTEDVWTAPQVKGWDYNRAYDRLEMAGVSHSMQRCSPAFGEEPLQKLWTYASCFPEVWDKMVDRVPGVGSANRYALTELYAYGKRPPKPAGMTWPDFVIHYVNKWGEKERPQVAASVRATMERHYRKTPDPILAYTVHPVSGCSWNFLLMLAARGDFKDRRRSGMNGVNLDDAGLIPVTAWRAYAEEYAEHLRAGTFHELGHPRAPVADPWTLLPAYAREPITA